MPKKRLSDNISKLKATRSSQSSSPLFTYIYSTINELYAKIKINQKFLNLSKNPLELKIYINKRKNVIFTSFKAEIGDSIKVKSKVIKKEKAEEKYSDAISSGNAAIFVCEDPYDENRIIVNMGNIPPYEKVVFISEFIQYTDYSKKYEFEIFRNIPFFKEKEYFYESSIFGEVMIETKNKIYDIEKEILVKDIKIIQEKYTNNKSNSYSIIYEIPKYSSDNINYIPTAKIYFDVDNKEPIVYTQNSTIANGEKNYIIHYRYKSESDNRNLNPGFFIFLIDQSGSMNGRSIEIASKALKLFIQSLPSKSYFQIIGFGSNYKLYNEIPKEYTKENINETLKIIDGLNANLGGTNIYEPLNYIYNNKNNLEIKLPKYIFLLTDGEIDNKSSTLELIEKNNSIYSIYSIGIGNDFDEDLIKNAGIIGKGNYNFCRELDGLNSIISMEISKATSSFISDFIMKNTLQNEKIELNEETNSSKIIRNNQIINSAYIIDRNNKNDKIDIDISYLDEDKKEIKKHYKIVPEDIEKGEELSKLIINNYILSHLNNNEIINKALKYQIFMKDTSLFAEIEFSKKVTEEMKLKIIGNKENNIINKEYILNKNYYYDCDDDILACKSLSNIKRKNHRLLKNSKKTKNIKDYFDECNKCISNFNNELKSISNVCEINNQPNYEEKIEKDKLMEMINTQDFIDGFWEENEKTKIIKKKYKKEFNLLKNLKNKNIDNKVAMTIIIIYFIKKEHPEFLNDLMMIIKKAELFIQIQTNESYENIIKEIKI